MTEENYKIGIRSYEVPLGNDLLEAITPTAVHHEIVFTQPDGTEYFLNGQAWDRDTGTPEITSLFGDNTLRADISLSNIGRGTSLTLLTESTCWEGNKDDWDVKFMRAAEVSSFINDQNLEYSPIGIISEAQNSNSVTSTVMTAMGTTYPPEIEALFAPGDDRVIIPDDRLLLQIGEFDDVTRDSLIHYVEAVMQSVEAKAIKEQILDDGINKKQITNDFDPKNAVKFSHEEFLQFKMPVENNIDSKPSSVEEPPVNKAQIDYEVGVNGTAYTAQVSGLEQGVPLVDFDTGVTIAGVPVENVFAQASNPDPSDIMLIDARAISQPDSSTQPSFEINADVTYAAQSLG